MASTTCAKGLLLFVCFQMSLLLFVTAQDNCTLSANATDTNSTICETNMTRSNETTASGNSSSLPCRLFTCSYADCSNVSKNANNTFCSGSDKYCELRRITQPNGTVYSTVCTSSCFKTCANASQNDCSINCCNSTSCINSTISSLTSSPLIVNPATAPTTTTTTTKATTASAVTNLTNGKKCHKQTCSGETCYKEVTTIGLCSPTQNFCMLKKTPSGTVVSWTASCIEDCSKETLCTSVNTACILECCNATTNASCLKLNGQVNIFGSGATALRSPVVLITFSVFFWLLSMGRSYG